LFAGGADRRNDFGSFHPVFLFEVHLRSQVRRIQNLTEQTVSRGKGVIGTEDCVKSNDLLYQGKRI
jgi:hypothetical protein